MEVNGGVVLADEGQKSDDSGPTPRRPESHPSPLLSLEHYRFLYDDGVSMLP